MGKQAKGLQALRRGRVNIADSREEITWSFFDFLTYAAAGQSNLTFFATPQGGTKTVIDTNMTLAAQIPSQQSFLIDAVSFEFQPGVAIRPENSSALAGAAAVNGFLQDVNEVAKSGFIDFTIGSKPYIRNSPLGQFPPSYGISGMVGAATTAAATTIHDTYGRWTGKLYEIIPITLESNQNFAMNVTWPTAIPLPSGVAGRLGCRLHGSLYRSGQ